jgi:hypothetical protein
MDVGEANVPLANLFQHQPIQVIIGPADEQHRGRRFRILSALEWNPQAHPAGGAGGITQRPHPDSRPKLLGQPVGPGGGRLIVSAALGGERMPDQPVQEHHIKVPFG